MGFLSSPSPTVHVEDAPMPASLTGSTPGISTDSRYWVLYIRVLPSARVAQLLKSASQCLCTAGSFLPGCRLVLPSQLFLTIGDLFPPFLAPWQVTNDPFCWENRSHWIDVSACPTPFPSHRLFHSYPHPRNLKHLLCPGTLLGPDVW